jgi:carbamoyltransferase
VLILGFSCFYHNSAAALLADGELVAAVEEERLSRVKNDARFPANAIRACLDWAGSDLDDVDIVSFYEKPHRKLARVLSTAVRKYPKGREHFDGALRKWADQSCWSPGELRAALLEMSPSRGVRGNWDGRLLFMPHHLSHAASAYYPSPFERAAILVADGVGEFATTTIGVGYPTERGGRRIDLIKEIRFPHSLGLLYSCFTHFLGFEVNEGEYKVMGLAPYGEPRYRDEILDAVVRIGGDGSFSVNDSLLTYATDRRMYDRAAMERLFGPWREPGEPLTSRHADVAASIQAVVEEIQLRLADAAYAATGEKRLVIAGGVGLNCVANGRILREGPFADVWVQPAPGDSGGAVGAAFEAWYGHLGRPATASRKAAPGRDGMSGARLGPAHSQAGVRRVLRSRGLRHVLLRPAQIAPTVADLLARGRIVAWFQGRMEFGPRALGGRSILADPRPAEMQRTLNMRVKRRESFRPFAPVVLRDQVADWFELDGRPDSILGAPAKGYDSPYMSLVAAVRAGVSCDIPDDARRLGGLDLQRTQISACTHVDESSRIQTVGPDDDWLLHAVLTEFQKVTSVPVLVNTSFNRSGEPIVCSPEDAVDCFLDTDIDYLCMEGTIAWKTAEAGLLLQRYQE